MSFRFANVRDRIRVATTGEADAAAFGEEGPAPFPSPAASFSAEARSLASWSNFLLWKLPDRFRKLSPRMTFLIWSPMPPLFPGMDDGDGAASDAAAAAAGPAGVRASAAPPVKHRLEVKPRRATMSSSWINSTHSSKRSGSASKSSARSSARRFSNIFR